MCRASLAVVFLLLLLGWPGALAARAQAPDRSGQRGPRRPDASQYVPPAVTPQQHFATHPLRPAEFTDVTPAMAPRAPGVRDEPGPGISILVEDELYHGVAGALTTYAADLTAEGYSVCIATATNGGGSAQQVKAWVINRYRAGSVGMMFVGDITVAWARLDPAVFDYDFPCDLYYMDIDGLWEATGEDGVFDVYPKDATEGPELFVGRLYASTLTALTGKSEATLVNDYLAKAHAYRTGALPARLPWRGLEYTDHGPYAMGLGAIFGPALVSGGSGYYTTADHYLDQLAAGHHFATLCTHGWPAGHIFTAWPTISAAYAHVYVHNPDFGSQNVQLRTGGVYRMKAWLNGSEVVTQAGCAQWDADQTVVAVTLEPGWNRLLCKTCQGLGNIPDPLEFSARFTDTQGAPLSSLRYQLDDPIVHGANPTPLDGEFINRWLVNGPYENADAATRLEHDYLGDETTVRPSTGDPAPVGTWRPLIDEESMGRPVFLASFFGGDAGGNTVVSPEDIQLCDPHVHFYRLNSCQTGRFTEQGYMAGAYVFNTTYGLLTVAPTKRAGEISPADLTVPLHVGLTFGEAYRSWFAAQAPLNDVAREYLYGIALNGDATLPVWWADDTNCNGLIDPDDPVTEEPQDSDYNGLVDPCQDCNGNRIGDAWDIASGFSPDDNANGTPDECEGACCLNSCCAEAMTDAGCLSEGGQFQGVGTTCTPSPCPLCPGDCNCDRSIDFGDINYFVAAVTAGESAWYVYHLEHGGQPPRCPYLNADADGSGTVDFGDINAFVDLVITQPPCP